MNSGKYLYKISSEKKPQVAKKVSLSLIKLFIFILETSIKVYK